ncbi:MAG TPA: glycosyltransferase [Candidatus Acidoferrales bacterium]|nr:glycosyltransferase [Candidatus Acidoferrales bacterium]
MRILAVIPGNGEGSSFIFARRQVEALAKLGIDVRIFHLRSRTHPRLLLTEWIRLRRTINEFSPEVVHAHYGTVTAFLCGLATLRPVAVTFRGSDLNFEPGIGFFRNCFGHLLSQLSALRAELICCTSARLKARLWWRKREVVVVPTGVNLDLFCPIPRDCVRRALGWDINERIVLFNAGRNPATKGLALACQAVEAAKRTLGFIRLVQLNGEVAPENVPLFLNAADCLVIASVSEGSPNILKEAMACNLPIASVDVGDAAERLKGVFPSSVTPRNSAALTQAIVEILAQPRRSNGREMILECSEPNISLRMQKAYAGIAQKQVRI